MRIGKSVLVFGMGLFLCLAAINNSLDGQGTFSAVKSAVDMQGTFKVPVLMWRAIESPLLVWICVSAIIVCEAVAGLLCLLGAVRMGLSRTSGAAFESAKSTALTGLTIAAALYFIGFHVIAGEWFMLWQNRGSPNLQEAFRDFASAMLMMLWVHQSDE
jgi:predicted small integral membrane protein